MVQFITDFDEMVKRAEELDEIITTYDPATSPILIPKWEGEYYVRILPVTRREDFLRQIGRHWNILPTTDDKNYSVIGCPKFTYGEECPVCDAITKAVGEKRADIADFKGDSQGKGNKLVQKRFLVRVLLINFKPAKDEKKPPKFQDFPLVRVIELPITVASDIKDKLRDEDFGPEAIIHPKKGKILKIKKSESIKNWWSVDVLSEYEIPQEFLDSADTWPEITEFLPKERTSHIVELIEKYARNVDPIIANHVLAIDVAGPSQRKLASANPVSNEELRAKLNDI